jgi:hypothetical protein
MIGDKRKYKSSYQEGKLRKIYLILLYGFESKPLSVPIIFPQK